MAYDSNVRCPRCETTFVAWRDSERVRVARCPGCRTEFRVAPGPYPDFRVEAGTPGHPEDRPLTDAELAARDADQAAAAEAARAEAARAAHVAYEARLAARAAAGLGPPVDRTYDLRSFIGVFLAERAGTGKQGLYDALARYFGLRLENVEARDDWREDRAANRHAWLFQQAIPLGERLMDPFPGLLVGTPCPACRPDMAGFLRGREHLIGLMAHMIEELYGDRLPPPITSAGLRDRGYDDSEPASLFDLL